MNGVLVLGAAGMLGHAICGRIARSTLPLWATVRSHWDNHPGLHAFLPQDRAIWPCDVLDDASIFAALQRSKPSVVVNCVGVIKQRPEASDAELSIGINALTPHRLARLCDDVGAKLIQLGTDCVFSGSRGNYTEEDVPDPPDLYGRTKLLGEVTRSPHLTLRTSIVGWQLAGSEGLAEWFRAQRGKSAQGWTGAVFSGVTTYTLSEIILRVIHEHSALTGLYHVAADPISKFDFLTKLNALTGFGVDLKKVEGLHIDRSLSAKKFLSATGIKPPSWDDMLADMAMRRGKYEQTFTSKGA